MSADNQPQDGIAWEEIDPETQHELVALAETLGEENPEQAAQKVSRRQLLGALAGSGAAAAVGGYATGRARADPKSTEEGTFGDGDEDWNAQDIDANHLAANSIDTENATISNVAASAYPSADQTVSNTTVTKVSIDTADFEHTEVIDADLTNNQLDVIKSGTYLVSLIVKWDSDSGWTTGDNANATVGINGTRAHFYSQRKIGTTGEGKKAVFIGELQAGDTVDARVYQDSGASQTLVGGAKETVIQMGRLG